MSGVSRLVKNFVDLTGCLADMMCTREWAFDSGSPMTTRHDAITDVAFRHAHTLGRVRQVQRFRSSIPFTAGRPRPVRSSSRPFCVRFNQRLRRYRLIRSLQHSIRGLWLGATRRDFLPLVSKPFPVRSCTALFCLVCAAAATSQLRPHLSVDHSKRKTFAQQSTVQFRRWILPNGFVLSNARDSSHLERSPSVHPTDRRSGMAVSDLDAGG